MGRNFLRIISFISTYSARKITSTTIFNYTSNDTTNTIKSRSNDHSITVKQMFNKSVQYTTPPKNIVKIIVCMFIITIYQHSRSIFNNISHTGTIWIIPNTIDTICAYKLDTNTNGDNKLNQSKIICHTLNKSIVIIVMITIYNAFDGNMNETDNIYPIVQQINNFDFIISSINVSDRILYEIKKLTVETTLFIVIFDRIQQTAECIFMLPLKFNTSVYDDNLLLFHLIIMQVDDFDLIVAIIDATNTVTVQVDHSYVILIVMFHELLVMGMDVFEMFFMVFYHNFVLNIDGN